MNRRTITQLPFITALAGVTGLAAAKEHKEYKEYTNETEALWLAKTYEGTPAQRIDRAKTFLNYLNENPEVDAVNALRFATSEGKTSKLSSEKLVENAKEYLRFLTA